MMSNQNLKRYRLVGLALIALLLSSTLAVFFFNQIEFSRAAAGAAKISHEIDNFNYSAQAISQAMRKQDPEQLYFQKTGHYLSNGFLNYWRVNDGLEQFGLPISEETEEDGRNVQYFEKARLEYHEEWRGTPYEVSLGLLGSEILASNPFVPVSALQYIEEKYVPKGFRYFAETGHTVTGNWRDKWEREGGLARFGYPLSEQFARTIDGAKYNVQLFERTEMRLKEGSDTIVLAALGPAIAEIKKVSTASVGYDGQTTLYTPDLYEHWVDINLKTQTARFMEGDRVVRTSLITSGKPGYATPTGTFYILRRVYNETMVGGQPGTEDYYHLDNVLYTQYFTNVGHALHYAWWRSQFGVTGSHGCINQDLATSKFAWQFLNVGSRVSIHY